MSALSSPTMLHKTNSNNRSSKIIIFNKISSRRKTKTIKFKTRLKRWSNRLRVRSKRLKPYFPKMIKWFIRMLDRFNSRQPSHQITLILEALRCKATKNHRMTRTFSVNHRVAYFRAPTCRTPSCKIRNCRILSWWIRVREGTEAMKRSSQRSTCGKTVTTQRPTGEHNKSCSPNRHKFRYHSSRSIRICSSGHQGNLMIPRRKPSNKRQKNQFKNAWRTSYLICRKR